MSRVHDMGGRFGDGPVTPEPQDAPVFAEEWHARALAITLACGALGQWNIDTSRHARERLAPLDYTRFSYYEKWLAGLASLLVEKQVLSRADLVAAEAGGGRQKEGTGAEVAAPHPLAARALQAQEVAAALAKGGPADRPSPIVPSFAPGDAVRCRRPGGNRLVEGGHTRLPTYAVGATGHILRLHGSHVLPDSAAHGLGEAPEPLYAVVFPADALWAHTEHPGDEVVLDLWQSYLEPV
ncbi:nitrile hydratase subunit beta [Phaeobacter inhibens]|uniref:nitrile hydratase subunit beta n=1 Tax=Phaeobacter inhibens TaxID=221822 RepID=UPI00016326D5|nr:nitrile hydratase subunit beta [Phaeobacter inhibens]AFO92072.1 nitrile hydratase subunit beta [Phaeobacter inhibens DSM 17395]AUQ46754.1 nitrile hydratase subunit beta [Phaeobacter inhibens]AXT23427.1 nitrile hydratase subunit beta [Phaeobacter inhibens]